MIDHTPGRHEHPKRSIALRTRTKWFGTWNFAVALSGRSCGWGTCERPRRTFVGHHTINRRGGLHFAEISITNGNRDRVLLCIGDRR